jgi:hypothetical protein
MPYAIHGMGPCPYPVVQRQPVFSSPGMGEGEEGVAIAEGVAEVDVAEEHDVVVVALTNKDDEPVEVIPLPDSPSPQLAYKQMTRIQIGPRGRPTGTIAQRMEAREASPVSSEIGSGMWPLPPPPTPSGPVTTAPPPPLSSAPSTALPLPDLTATSGPPPLRSSIGGQILRRFSHLAKPSRPGHRPGAWDLPRWP